VCDRDVESERLLLSDTDRLLLPLLDKLFVNEVSLVSDNEDVPVEELSSVGELENCLDSERVDVSEAVLRDEDTVTLLDKESLRLSELSAVSDFELDPVVLCVAVHVELCVSVEVSVDDGEGEPVTLAFFKVNVSDVLCVTEGVAVSDVSCDGDCVTETESVDDSDAVSSAVRVGDRLIVLDAETECDGVRLLLSLLLCSIVLDLDFDTVWVFSFERELDMERCSVEVVVNVSSADGEWDVVRELVTLCEPEPVRVMVDDRELEKLNERESDRVVVNDIVCSLDTECVA
jgi:hypothetical protein